MNSIQFNGKYLDFNEAKIMAIINLTSDSFYKGSRFNANDKIYDFIDKALEHDTAIIDVGAISSRPNAKEVSETDELTLLLPAIEVIRKRYPDIFISIDTFRASVATKMIDSGADMINDIFAGRIDDDMFSVVAKANIPYVMMHMQGNPQDMQDNIQYENVSLEILSFLANRKRELNQLGANQIIIDPGFGFGKTIEHNFEILKKLEVFKILESPVLAGLSRKSMIYKSLNIDPSLALNGTSALNMIALEKGASILRVHDPKEAREVIKLHRKLND